MKKVLAPPRRWIRVTAVICILLFCFSLSPITHYGSPAFAMGLGVDPGEIVVRNIPLGKVVPVSKLTGEKLKIRNKGSKTHTYTISILKTKETTSKLKGGYEDIPDINWIWPEKNEVQITGNSVREVELYLRIPKRKRYYNKKYQAIIEVKSKKDRPTDLFVLAVQPRICLSTLAAGGKSVETEKLSLTIIKTEDKWGSDLSFLPVLKKKFSGLRVEEIGYSTKEGKRLVKKLGIDFLPAFIFDKSIEKTEEFDFLVKSKMIIKKKDYYLMASNRAREGVYLNRKRTPNTLEVFSMSQCPFSIRALNKLITAQKEGKIAENVKIEVHYIATLISDGKRVTSNEQQDLKPETRNSKPETRNLVFRSLHGTPEVEEDMRQLCIKKYYPDKLLDYLLLRNEEIRSTLWEKQAKEAGIDDEVIRKCIYSKEAETLLKEDIKKAEELNISSSPTFLYENRIQILDSSLLKELPGLENLEIERGGCGR